jgi:hypothetical protein
MRVLVVAALFALGVGAVSCHTADDPTVAAVLGFDGRDRLLLSERTPARQGWEMTSGSLFVRDGRGWTGEPNRGRPDGKPHGTTNSAVFRLRSLASNYDNADVSVRFRVLRFTGPSAGPVHDYDGVHLWLRYRDPGDLYALSVARRDGRTVIKRKTASGYETLVTGRTVPTDSGWHQAKAGATNVADGVRLQLWLDGQLVAETVDRHPLPAGRVGLRADNCELELDDLDARTL